MLEYEFIVKDEFGNPVIDGFYNDTKLIKAMCKLMNFTYQPSQTEYWKHGKGQGKNYLYITTGDAQNPSQAQNKNSLSGKILRVTDDGKAAPGNPFDNLMTRSKK